MPRNSKNLRLVLRPKHFAKLQDLAHTDGLGRKEPIASVVERLIDASELPGSRRLDVHLRSQPAKAVA